MHMHVHTQLPLQPPPVSKFLALFSLTFLQLITILQECYIRIWLKAWDILLAKEHFEHSLVVMFIGRLVG